MDDKELMIESQLTGRDIYSEKVLDAMRAVDRKLFVPDEFREMAYDDTPLPIGGGQIINQPYIVAYMAQVMDLQPDDRVLEVGTGCGYNAAVLSRLVTHVYSLEIIDWLAGYARENLDKANIPNVTVQPGDGLKGWQEQSPFDKIMLTAPAGIIPKSLKDQLRPGGKILAPVSENYQKLILLEKHGEGDFRESELIPVRFVPITGETNEPARWKKGMPKND
jgi:protein-L-isoaspartate(D-aspartate) O-methyltransferase